jgi:hypothetical protein
VHGVRAEGVSVRDAYDEEPVPTESMRIEARFQLESGATMCSADAREIPQAQMAQIPGPSFPESRLTEPWPSGRNDGDDRNEEEATTSTRFTQLPEAEQPSESAPRRRGART